MNIIIIIIIIQYFSFVRYKLFRLFFFIIIINLYVLHAIAHRFLMPQNDQPRNVRCQIPLASHKYQHLYLVGRCSSS